MSQAEIHVKEVLKEVKNAYHSKLKVSDQESFINVQLFAEKTGNDSVLKGKGGSEKKEH